MQEPGSRKVGIVAALVAATARGSGCSRRSLIMEVGSVAWIIFTCKNATHFCTCAAVMKRNPSNRRNRRSLCSDDMASICSIVAKEGQ